MKLQELSALIALNAVERSYASVPHASTSIPRHPDFLLTIMFCCFFELVAAVSLLCHENTPWRFYGNLVFSHSRSPRSWKLKLGSRNPHFQKEYDMSVHHETLTPQNPKLSADVLRIFFFPWKARLKGCTHPYSSMHVFVCMGERPVWIVHVSGLSGVTLVYDCKIRYAEFFMFLLYFANVKCNVEDLFFLGPFFLLPGLGRVRSHALRPIEEVTVKEWLVSDFT